MHMQELRGARNRGGSPGRKNRDICHERYCLLRIITVLLCIKGFINGLSHDCHIDIDRDVSTNVLQVLIR